MKFLFLAGIGFLLGCSSLLPSEFQPMSQERCQKMDMREYGKKDSTEGFTRGTKFDFFVQDCARYKVTLDRNAYDQGYDEGMESYCSCDRAFGAGVREEFLEIKSLYYSCSDEQKKRMQWAHQMGDKQKADDSLMQKTSTAKVNYYEDKILARAKEVCTQPATN